MEQIVIKLEESDDITSIRSRVDFALIPPAMGARPAAGNGKPARLLLIVPRKNKALQSLVHMKLLARAAQTRAVKMAIVSDHPTVRDYAKEAGIKAFGNLHSAKWAGWVTTETPVAAPEETLPPVAPVPPEEGNGRVKRVKNKKYRVIQGSGRVNVWQQLGALILLGILALALVVGVFALLPQATVTMIPVAQPLETNLVVKADPTVKTVNFKTLTFPARTAQVELALSGEIETIETELAPVGQAQGSVTFINRTDQAQLIPISTTLTTSAGEAIRFVTAFTTTIPPGAGATSTPTLVLALEPGPEGNVGAGQINRFEDPGFGLLARVINEQSLSGGTMEPAKIVVQDDKERLQAYLRQKIQQEGSFRGIFPTPFGERCRLWCVARWWGGIMPTGWPWQPWRRRCRRIMSWIREVCILGQVKYSTSRSRRSPFALLPPAWPSPLLTGMR
jgi:hypothetical protein